MTNYAEPSPRGRLVPDQALPPYAYVPGRHPHPVRDPRGHSFGVDSDDPEPPEPQRWQTCRTYLYGIDLFNHGYYWEAHEAWETLWRTHCRHSLEGQLLRGLIALAAAGVKAREGNARGAVRHARRAGAIFRGLGAERSVVLGLVVAALTVFAEEIAADPPCRPAAQRSPPDVVFPTPLALG